MWVRKRIDIGWTDLLVGLVSLGRSERKAPSPVNSARELRCLSVRSGFDLLLTALQLPPKTEILMSAVTIADMHRIVTEHGLVPVPVDISPMTLAPSLDDAHAKLTPKARVIVVTQLFGGRVPMGPIAEFAREHQLLLIEDLAQSFVGVERAEQGGADVRMFSFGPIKDCTALGGALLQVSDPALLSAMHTRHAALPQQARGSYAAKLLKYALLKFISGRVRFGLFVVCCKLVCKDYADIVSRSVRAFPGREFFQRIRQRPAPALLALLERKLKRYRRAHVQPRVERAALLKAALAGAVELPATTSSVQTAWAVPVLVDDPCALIARLRRAGFDAARAHSLCVVPSPGDRAAAMPTGAAELLKRVVILPCYPEMPEREILRLAQTVRAGVQTKAPVAAAALTLQPVR